MAPDLQRTRSMKNAFFILASMSILTTTTAVSWLPKQSAFAATSEQQSTSVGSARINGIFSDIEQLVRETYPKAKISKEGDSLHFEYKLKSEIGYYSGRPV